MQKIPSHSYLLVCNGLLKDGVGVSRGTVFQNIRPGAVSITGYFVGETLGGLS